MRTEDGCDFVTVQPLERRPSDAVVHAPSGGAAYVMNGVGDASGLWVSTDRGHSFTLIQTFDPTTEQTTGLRYIDEDTLFVSGYSRVDDGAGLAWTVDVASGSATPVALPEGVSYPYVLAAAAPTVVVLGRRGDQIVFWGPIDDIERNEYVAPTWPTWGTLSADGQTAWISGTDSGRGVVRGTLDGADTATWETLAATTTAGCVEPVGEDLYICGLARFDSFDVLKVSPADAVDGVLDFRSFRGVRSDCPADSAVGTVCPSVWRELAPYFGIDPDGGQDAGEPDPPVVSDVGGTVDVGVTHDADTHAPPPAGGCCATAHGNGARDVLPFVLLLAVCRQWRRRSIAR